jgi:hypothetical protein
MEKKRFRVRLVRPVFEYADVEVEAGEEFEAAFTALAGAGTIPADAWRGQFAPEEYGVDAVCVTETADGDEEIFTAIAGEKKYLLLKADTGSGEGEVVYQPWIGEVSDLMLADLCAESADATSALRNYHEELRDLPVLSPGDDRERFISGIRPALHEHNRGFVERVLAGSHDRTTPSHEETVRLLTTLVAHECWARRARPA